MCDRCPTNVQLHDLQSQADILNETKQMIVGGEGATRSSKQVADSERESKYAFDRPRHCLLTELRLREGASLAPIWHNFC